MSAKLSVKDLDLRGKKVLMRVDFNVPQDKQGNISDDSRILATVPSIQYVLDQGASLILMSHLGRPKGRCDPKQSLAPCAKKLSQLLKRPVKMASDCIGHEVEKMAGDLKAGDVLLLENLRFHDAEEKPEKDPQFAQALAKLGDVYVNDAFGTAHRAHSSTASIAKYFPDRAAAGLLLEKEIEVLSKILSTPSRPFYAIIGGAKVSTKIGALKALLKVVDGLLIGGAMAYTFFKAQGLSVGSSPFEAQFIEEAQRILDEAKAKGIKLLLPVDLLIAQEINQDAEVKVAEAKTGIPEGWEGVDIGLKTRNLYAQEIQNAATLLWNGPLGIFEIEKFAEGTNSIALAVSQLNAETIVGGGDSIAAIEAAGVADKITHLSTGGGATLEFLEFGTLPGIEALSDRIDRS